MKPKTIKIPQKSKKKIVNTKIMKLKIVKIQKRGKKQKDLNKNTTQETSSKKIYKNIIPKF